MRSNLYLPSLLCSLLLLGACSDNSNSEPSDPLPVYDFSEVDTRLQQYLDDNDKTEGISVTIVDADQGTVHDAAFGDHEPNIVTLIASVSKFASATLLMAIHEDEAVDFDIDAPISNYLPWEGVYGDATTTQLLSNTSGIPGIFGDIELHECQYDPDADAEDCEKLIYSTELPGSQPPGIAFEYGGSQWHLSRAVAVQVTNSEWNQAFDRYVGEPCGLDVFKYGNMLEQGEEFTGHPDSLVGIGNPLPGGGAISSMRDMAKLLLMHLRDGMCGDNRILSPDGVMFMQVNRIEGLIKPFFWAERSYGMGWWGHEYLPNVFTDRGAYGSAAWIDTQRMVGGFVAIDDYSKASAADSWALVFDEIIPLVGELVDEARLAAEE